MYMNYFIAQEFGEDYRRADEVVDLSRHRRTIDKVITDCFEQVVYSINQPTGARNFQAVFWNIAYYDRYYFESLFGEFRFPDGSRPDWEGLSWLQKRFMKWFNAERLKTVLTFPVETMALLTRDGDVMDAEWGDFTAQMYAEGHSFFTYMSDNADSLSSCCRLRNEIQDNGFSYTLGAGGVSTGSKSVLTINLNRCIQYAERQGIPYLSFLEEVVDLTHKVQMAFQRKPQRAATQRECFRSSTRATSTCRASTSPSASTAWSRRPNTRGSPSSTTPTTCASPRRFWG